MKFTSFCHPFPFHSFLFLWGITRICNELNCISLWSDTKCWSDFSWLYKLSDFHPGYSRSTTKTSSLGERSLTLNQLVYLLPSCFLFVLLTSLPFRFELWAISGTNIFQLSALGVQFHISHWGACHPACIRTVEVSPGHLEIIQCSVQLRWVRFEKKYQNFVGHNFFFSFYNFNFVSILSKF